MDRELRLPLGLKRFADAKLVVASLKSEEHRSRCASIAL
jgi:hypothetical protein